MLTREKKNNFHNQVHVTLERKTTNFVLSTKNIIMYYLHEKSKSLKLFENGIN